jgi:hypothetical protein
VLFLTLLWFLYARSPEYKQNKVQQPNAAIAMQHQDHDLI